VSYLCEDQEAQETAHWVEKAGRRALTIAGDVADPVHCRELIDRALQAFGRLDILVNNAAFQATHDSIEEITDEEWDRTFRTNIYSMFYLVRAKERGVDVRLIADRTTPCERESGIEPLAAAGVPVWIDAQARVAHAKAMVIDGAVTLTGSMNWTRGAAVSSEDLNLISSPAVAAAYAARWHERLALSVRFDRREDWCRVSARP
jgi:NAD(P)-dependent dehydrogenase (short-subunit alcohol dehydrogenase family)